VIGPQGTGWPLAAAERVLGDAGIGFLRELRSWDLAQYPGIGPARATRLVAARELGRRAYGVGNDGPSFDTPESVFFQTRDLCEDEREHFVVLLLNARQRLMRRDVVSLASLNSSIVHPREVFRPAIRNAAAAIVLVHNHPSGDPSPSRDDVEITRRLLRAGELLGIPVLDHVIVAGRRYVSLRREQLMVP
jgi:DNA repair protein RadC